MTTKKREYEKPSMQVFELNHQQHLLAGSDSVSTTMDGTFTEEDLAREFNLGSNFDFGDDPVITSEDF